MNNNLHDYRKAFWAAVAVCIVLLAGLIWMWRTSHHEVPGKTTASSPTDSQQQTIPPAATPTNAPVQETPLVPVQLTPERMQSIGVKLGKVQLKAVNDEIRTTGNVDVDEQRIAYVQTRFPGWIRKVYADATYKYVKKGQPLFTIYSPDLVTTEQEYLLAKKNAESLQKSTVSGVASGADSLLTAARERLEQWEVPASEIQKLETTGKVITDLAFNSPVSGYVTERNALPNMYVQPETRLYTVADLSTVWVYAQVFQNDLGRIKPGDPASVTVDAFPGKTFKARVDQILPQIDMNTRTAKVRLVLANPGMKLSPGMYVNVLLNVPMGRQLVVPASAVFHSGTRQMAFVSRGQGSFEPREIQTGDQVGEDIVITKGLREGDEVAISANFLIDSESQLQAAAGAFVPPPPSAGQAAAMNRSAEEIDVDLTSDPSPPHKGNNLFRLKMTRNGQPLGGAKVSATFFMPAMPSMGMAEMKNTIDLADKGNGLYEGKGELGSGGRWQVTVVVEVNGKPLASKQLTMNATGGM
jgi:membrane fusion protein, copper/silver efflux system